MFRHAAYRAVDQALLRMETGTDEGEWRALQALLKTSGLAQAPSLNELMEMSLGRREQLDPVRTALRERIEWTVAELGFRFGE